MNQNYKTNESENATHNPNFVDINININKEYKNRVRLLKNISIQLEKIQDAIEDLHLEIDHELGEI